MDILDNPVGLDVPDCQINRNVRVILQEFHEVIEEELGIYRTRGCFWMELGREPGHRLVADAFVRAVVHVDELGLPVGRDRAVIDSEAVVLRGDEAAGGGLAVLVEAHGLVVAAVAVLELGDPGSGGEGEYLVAHADAVDGLAGLHELAHMLHGLGAEIRVAGAIRDEEAIKGFTI